MSVNDCGYQYRLVVVNTIQTLVIHTGISMDDPVTEHSYGKWPGPFVHDLSCFTMLSYKEMLNLKL